MNRRTRLVLGLAGVTTAIAFLWPLLIGSSSQLAGESAAPLLFALILPLVIAVVVVEVDGGRLDARTVAMLGVLTALGAALRPLGAGTAGVELVFFLVILGGRVFGSSFGYLLGVTTLAASALITAGVGPWLPYQMAAAGWIGLGAGALPPVRGKLEIGVIALYGALAAFLFGLAMNLSFWPFTLGTGTELSFVAGGPVLDNLRRFLLFDLATSMGWDLGRAVTTVVLVVVLGRPILRTLHRAAGRAAFGATVEIESVERHEASLGDPVESA